LATTVLALRAGLAAGAVTGAMAKGKAAVFCASVFI
jgi:hypothetical protein